MTDMTKRLSQLSEDMAKDSLISDALKLRSHLSLGNYLVSRPFSVFERIFMGFHALFRVSSESISVVLHI